MNTAFHQYNSTRDYFLARPDSLIALEEYLSNELFNLIQQNILEIVNDYNEAANLFPFWGAYPPDDRGRAPVKDQYPWIEVGEHAVGAKLPRILASTFDISDPGIPTGADQRFLLRNDHIRSATGGITDAAWLWVDIKSAGPRDDADHAVMSHNQISGDGIWEHPDECMRNMVLTAQGQRASHDFHCSVPPLVVFSSGVVAPIITMALKPLYSMLDGHAMGRNGGQLLSKITTVTIPNGLLLTCNPNYLDRYPGLLFPGKDDKGKNPLKVRARVSFELLRKIAAWRVMPIGISYP